MTDQITVTLPTEILQRAEQLARCTGRSVDQLLAETIELSLRPLGTSSLPEEGMAEWSDERWSDHFTWSADGTRILGRTPCGRATVVCLQLNNVIAVYGASGVGKRGLAPASHAGHLRNAPSTRQSSREDYTHDNPTDSIGSASGSCPARLGADVQGLGTGSGSAHADE